MGREKGKEGKALYCAVRREPVLYRGACSTNTSPQGPHRLGWSEETRLHKDVLQEHSSTSILFPSSVIIQIRPVTSHRCIASFARPHKPLEQQQLLHSQHGLTRLDTTI